MYSLAQTFNVVDPEVFGVVGVRGDEDVDVPRARMEEVLSGSVSGRTNADDHPLKQREGIGTREFKQTRWH